MIKSFLRLAAASLALAVAPASAHDFFLLPDSFHPHPNADLTIRATIGSHFPTPEIVVPADRAERIWATGGGNPEAIVAGTDETSLLLALRGARGTSVVAVRSMAREVDYEEERIPLILAEYRFAPAAAAAVDNLPRPRTWRVLSRRFAKTIVCAADCSGFDEARRPLDGTLEFVAAEGERRRYRLLQAGKPLGDYPVDLVDAEGQRTHLSTDASGTLHLPGDQDGPVMLFAAFLSPPKAQERFTLDLTSLTIQP